MLAADARWSAVGFGLTVVLLLAWIAAFSIGQSLSAASYHDGAVDYVTFTLTSKVACRAEQNCWQQVL